jgi:hypothetical protein
VLLVCRWVLARLRHQRFFSLEELNAAIRPLLVELNERPFQKLPGSRRSVFETLDRPAMRPLPATVYVYAEWKRVRAAFDYHVEIDRHYHTASSDRSCGPASAPPQSRCSIAVSALLPMCAPTSMAFTPPARRTCPMRIVRMPSGPRSG